MFSMEDIGCAYHGSLHLFLFTHSRVKGYPHVFFHNHANSCPDFDSRSSYYYRYSVLVNKSLAEGVSEPSRLFYVGIGSGQSHESSCSQMIPMSQPGPPSDFPPPLTFDIVPIVPSCPVCNTPHKISYVDRWCPYCVAWICWRCILQAQLCQETDMSAEVILLTENPVLRTCAVPPEDFDNSNPFALRGDFDQLWKIASSNKDARETTQCNSDLRTMSLREHEFASDAEIEYINKLTVFRHPCPHCKKVGI